MKEYLFEMHAHTNDVSVCANCTGETLLALYTKAGYDGVVLTNHMNRSTFRRPKMEDAPWDEKVTHFLRGFCHLKSIAGTGMVILPAMEICFYDCPNDYLVYGITEEFLRGHGDLMTYKPKAFSVLAHENNLLFIQAHPLRRGMKIENWNILDGYEVFNGNPRHYSSNEAAVFWANYHKKMICTSGSDFHEVEDVGTGGIYFQEPIKTNDDLLSALRSGSYRLKTTEIVHTRKE